MSSLAIALVEFSRRHAASVAALFLVLALAGGFLAAERISIDTDIDKLLSPNLPWRQREAEMERAFPQKVDVLVVVVDGDSPDRAADASADLAAALARETAVFKSVRRPDSSMFFAREGLLFLDRDQVQETIDRIIAAQPLLGTLAADPTLRGVFGALDLAAQGAIHGDAEPETLEPTFRAVADATAAALEGRYAPMSWRKLFVGRTPSRRELRRFILTKPILDYGELQPGKRAAETVHAVAARLGLTPERGVRVRVTGPVALSDAQFSTLSRGAGFSSALSASLLVLWLFLGIRSWRIVAAILATLLAGLVACGAFTVLAVGALNPISVAFAVLFVGIAVDFGIQFSLRYRDERFRDPDFATALRRAAGGVGRALAIAAAATAVGFLSFVPTDYTGVSDLGKIAGAGMIIALILNLTLLPALLTLLKPRGERHPVGFAWATSIERFLLARRVAVLGIAGLLALGSAALLTRLGFDFNPLHLQSAREEAVATLYDLTADPDTTPYTIDILTPSPGVAAALAARIDRLPEVSRAMTVASFVPSDQAAKLAIIADANELLGPTLSPPSPKPTPTRDETLAAIATTDRDVKEAAAKGGVEAKRLAVALDTVLTREQATLAALDANLAAAVPRRLDELRQMLMASPASLETLPKDVTRDWVAADGRAKVEVYPRGDVRDNRVLRAFADAVTAVAPNAIGTPISIQESARTVIRAFATAVGIAVVAIAILLFAALRRLVDVALVLAPLLLAGLLTLATGVAADLPLNFANIIALPLLLGVGVAFDIYFVVRWRDGHDDLLGSSTARAILFSALATGTAFGSLALSPHPGTAEMGQLLTLALFYTLVCTFIVLPTLLGPVRRAPAASGRN